MYDCHQLVCSISKNQVVKTADERRKDRKKC